MNFPKLELVAISMTLQDSYLQNKQDYQNMLDSLCSPWVPVDSNDIPECSNDNVDFFDRPFIINEFLIASNSRGDKSASGIDGINYEVLHNIPHKYKIILLNIFNDMYAFESYPEEWNDVFVHFSLKPNGGVRPLALTSCCSKLFELMLSNPLRWWLETQKILPIFQAGF